MALLIDSGPIEATHPLHQVPKEKWRSLMVARRCFMDIRLAYDCRCLVEFVDDAKAMYGELGFASTEEMVRDGLGLEPDEIRIAVEWLRINPQDQPIPLEDVETLARQGRPKKGEEKHSNRIIKGGTNSKYTIARLNRDRPDLARRVQLGELSANAAAIEAGFRKRLTAIEAIRRLIPKLTDQERIELRRLLESHHNPAQRRNKVA